MEGAIIQKNPYIVTFDKDSVSYEGYTLETNKGNINLLIELGNFCCEEIDWSYRIESKGSLVGAKVKKIWWCPDENEDGKRTSSIVILTDKFDVYLYVSNDNGYYPHKVYASWGGYENISEI